ncbi:MAG: hypothetical protein IJV62_03825, partial [Eggerthellaceae bacterium]|nr:hypothetical protein [Eggerthellaceae bacterium]
MKEMFFKKKSGNRKAKKAYRKFLSIIKMSLQKGSLMPHNAPYKIRYVTKPKPSKSTVKNDMSKAPNKLQENP